MAGRLRFLKGMQSKLLTQFRNKQSLSVRELAKLLEVKENALKKWISETRTLPENIFNILVEKDNNLEQYHKYILEKLPENWGDSKGGNLRINNIEDIAFYCQGIRAAQDEKRKAKDKTYFTNQNFDRLLKENVDLNAVLAVCLLTDGSITKNRISYYTTDKELKEVLYNTIVKLSEYKVGIYKDKDGGYNIRVSDTRLVQKLEALSPTYKKLPGKGQRKEEYYSETQPSVKFLNNVDLNTIKWCIRFAFSTDGCISLSQRNNAYLCLTCYHQSLPLEWKEILEKYGILLNIVKERNSWCEISGLKSSRIGTLIRFYRFCGFVPGVKVTAKSKYYKGLPKNEILRKAIHYEPVA